MPHRKISLALLASMVALLLVTWADAVTPGTEVLPPYIGIIKNKTKHEVSIPSKNSLGTFVVPPKGWISYVVWEDKFNLTAYKEGKPIFAQQVAVTPGAFPYMNEKYDFMTEIVVAEPTKAGKKVYKKKKYRGKGKKKADPC